MSHTNARVHTHTIHSPSLFSLSTFRISPASPVGTSLHRHTAAARGPPWPASRRSSRRPAGSPPPGGRRRASPAEAGGRGRQRYGGTEVSTRRVRKVFGNVREGLWVFALMPYAETSMGVRARRGHIGAGGARLQRLLQPRGDLALAKRDLPAEARSDHGVDTVLKRDMQGLISWVLRWSHLRKLDSGIR